MYSNARQTRVRNQTMNTQPKGTSLFLKVIGAVWLLWVFLDYWFKHPLYAVSLANMKFAIPMIHMIVAGGFFALMYSRMNRGLNWIWLVGFFLVALWSGTLVDLLMYGVGIEYSGATIVAYLGRTLLYVAILAILTLSAMVLGRKATSYLSPTASLPSSVHIAVGLSVYMVISFMLLAFGIFEPIAIAALVAGPLLAYYPLTLEAFQAAKASIEFGEEYHGWILGGIVAIVLMNVVTFAYTLSPYPVGFDAQKYYINLPKLMAEAGQLQKGYQPYNWSLLQAAGYKVTGRPEFLLILSWYGLVLVQLSIWQFGRHCLKMKALPVVLAMTLFTFMPSVTQQASQELKIDLALAFYMLTMMICVFKLLETMRRDGNRIKMVSLAFLIGWLGGIALGIKLTAVIAIFGAMAIIWYQALGRMAFVGFFLLFLGVALFAGLDSRAGLRAYHDSVIWLQVLSSFAGFAFLFFAFKAQIKKGLKLMYLSTVVAMASVLIFSPWLLKNYTEIEQPTLMKLLNGTNHGPDINMRIIDKNLRDAK